MAVLPRANAAGSLAGKLSDAATGAGIRRVMVRAYAHGRSSAFSTMTENDGSYLLEDLPAPRGQAGAYAVCVPSVDAREASLQSKERSGDNRGRVPAMVGAGSEPPVH